MSRKILFRGKLISDSDNHKKNQWVYGSYFKDRNNISYIYNKKENYFYIVDAETVSQYIGKKYNGDIARFVSMYEGDIVFDADEYYGVLKYNENKHQYFIYYGRIPEATDNVNFIIVGNIWDNPELTEKNPLSKKE